MRARPETIKAGAIRKLRKEPLVTIIGHELVESNNGGNRRRGPGQRAHPARRAHDRGWGQLPGRRPGLSRLWCGRVSSSLPHRRPRLQGAQIVAATTQRKLQEEVTSQQAGSNVSRFYCDPPKPHRHNRPIGARANGFRTRNYFWCPLRDDLPSLGRGSDSRTSVPIATAHLTTELEAVAAVI